MTTTGDIVEYKNAAKMSMVEAINLFFGKRRRGINKK